MCTFPATLVCYLLFTDTLEQQLDLTQNDYKRIERGVAIKGIGRARAQSRLEDVTIISWNGYPRRYSNCLRSFKVHIHISVLLYFC